MVQSLEMWVCVRKLGGLYPAAPREFYSRISMFIYSDKMNNLSL